MTKAANDNVPGRVYTLAEAAEHLRLTKRATAGLAKKNGACMVHGRTILFEEKDLETIKEVMRCPSNLSSEKALTFGTSGARYEGRVYTRLLEQAIERRRNKSASKLKRAS